MQESPLLSEEVEALDDVEFSKTYTLAMVNVLKEKNTQFEMFGMNEIENFISHVGIEKIAENIQNKKGFIDSDTEWDRVNMPTKAQIVREMDRLTQNFDVEYEIEGGEYSLERRDATLDTKSFAPVSKRAGITQFEQTTQTSRQVGQKIAKGLRVKKIADLGVVERKRQQALENYLALDYEAIFCLLYTSPSPRD